MLVKKKLRSRPDNFLCSSFLQLLVPKSFFGKKLLNKFSANEQVMTTNSPSKMAFSKFVLQFVITN